MTTDEREQRHAAAHAHVENLEAQRAYAASVAPPPRPPLPQHMPRRARLAGGVGGAAMLLGVDLAVVGIGLLLLPLLVESIVRWSTAMLVDVDAIDASASLGVLLGGPWPWIGGLLVAIGACGVALGGALSVRTLRSAGFPHPVRLTLGAFALALGGRVVLGVFTAPFSSLVSPLLERGLAGVATGGAELAATIVALGVLALMNVAIAAATGMVAWWTLAHATRPQATPPAPVVPAWAGSVQREG